MIQSTVILGAALLLSTSTVKAENVTFKNVTISGYSVFTKKFERNITESNNLQENLPKSIFDKIEIVDQFVPILYKNSISDIDGLDELVLENVRLEEIQPGAFKNLPLLRRLSLKNNQLQEIRNGVFNHLSLSTLDLGSNRISTIGSNALSDLPDLLNINLADNLISNWDSKWFHNTPLLTRVSMQNNSLATIPDKSFKNLEGVKKYGSVDLTVNLIFSYNKIANIEPKAFEGLEKINNLWLDNNLLTSFDENLLKGVQVKDLRLNSNQITCFDGKLDEVFKANATHIDGNPIECQCLEKIKKWVEKHDDKYVPMFYAKMNCDAERIKAKMVALEKRLKEIKNQEVEVEVDNEVETLE